MNAQKCPPLKFHTSLRHWNHLPFGSPRISTISRCPWRFRALCVMSFGTVCLTTYDKNTTITGCQCDNERKQTTFETHARQTTVVVVVVDIICIFNGIRLTICFRRCVPNAYNNNNNNNKNNRSDRDKRVSPPGTQ